MNDTSHLEALSADDAPALREIRAETFEAFHGVKRCEQCLGDGWISVYRRGDWRFRETCSLCDGRGTIELQPMEECNAA